MRLLHNKLFQSTAVYAAANVLNGLLIFALLPIFTRYMSPEEYGIVSLFRTIAGFVFPFLSFFASVGRMHTERKEMNFPRYIGNAVLLMILNTALAGLLLLVISAPLSDAIDYPGNWLWAVVVFAFSNGMIRLLLMLFQMEKRPFVYGAFQVSLSLFNFLLAVYLVVEVGLSWEGAISADTWAYASFGLIAFAVILKKFKPEFKPDRRFIRDLLLFNMPIAFHMVGKSVITMSDKLFISYFSGLEETGIFSASYQVSLIIFVLATAFQSAFMPEVYERLKRNGPGDKEHLVRVTYLYGAVMLLLALILSLGSSLIVETFLGNSFSDSAQFIPWLAFGYVLNGLYMVHSVIISYSKKTYLIMYITLSGAVLNLVLNYLLIYQFGSIGAAISSLITFFCIAIFTWHVSNKVVSLPWLVVLRSHSRKK